MKRLQRAGLGSRKRKAKPLTEEEQLWKLGPLGDISPQSLVNTIIAVNELYFALRSGGEHCQLRSHNCHHTLARLRSVDSDLT